MAVPALFKISINGDGYDITMMFYLNESNPPSPIRSGVSIVTRSAGDVYVGAFQSEKMATPTEFDDEVEKLDNAITDAGSYNPGVYYRASYSYPFDKRTKHQEVWFDKI